MKRIGKSAVLLLSGSLICTLSACGGDDSGSASDGGVKIGVIAPMSGAFAEIGDNISNGFKLGVEQAQADGLAKGVAIDVEVKDEQADATAASQVARDFMSDGTMLLAGMLTSTACGAVAPLVDQAGGALVTAVCAGNDLSGAYSGKAPYERTFAVAPRDSMVSTALGKVVAEKFPSVTDYNVFGYDYTWGHETWEVFRDTMSDAGTTVNTNQEFFVPLGEANFRNQVSAMSRGLGDKDSSAAFLATYGAGTTAFLKQADAFGLTDKVSLLASAGGYETVARSLKGAAPDMWNAYDYVYAAYDSPENDKFVKGYQDEYGDLPVAWSYDGYQAGYAYVAAIDAAGSGDPDDVVEALSNISFTGPAGEMKMDGTTHQLLAPVVVSHTVGDADAPDGVKVLDTEVVPAADLIETH